MLRPRDADRRGDRRRADLLPARAPSSAGARPTPGIRPEDGRSAIAAAARGDRGDAARAARRGDDGERRRRSRAARRANVVAGALPRRGRGAQPRRRERAEAVAARWSTRCTWAASERRVRRRRRVEELLPRLPDQPATRAPLALAAARRCAAAASSRVRASTGGGSDANALRGDGLRLRQPRQRHRAQPHARRAVSARARSRRCSTSATRSSPTPRRRQADVLKLRRGTVRRRSRRRPRRRSRSTGERRPRLGRRGAGRAGAEAATRSSSTSRRSTSGSASGGFDIVHVNLTRGLDGGGAGGRARDEAQLHARSSTPVEPVEARRRAPPRPARRSRSRCCRCTASWRRRPGRRRRRRPGAGRLRADRRRRAARRALRATSPSCASAACSPATSPPRPPTAASTRRSAWSARSHAAAEPRLGRGIVGPGPGILGSATALGHGGMAALDGAHAALALGCRRCSRRGCPSGDPRERHRGLSHHTAHRARAAARRRRGRRPAAWTSSGRSRRRARDELGEAARRPPPARSRRRSTSPATRQRPAGADDGPRPRRGPALLRRAARRRAPRSRSKRLSRRRARVRGCTGRGPAAGRNMETCLRRRRLPRRAAGRCPLRGPGPRLPRLPRVRARPLAQHAERLPHRPAPVRRVPRRARADAARRRGRPTSPTSSPSLATGRRDRPACSARDVHRKAACLRSFYRHLRREELIDDDPTADAGAPRRAKKLPQVLSYAEVQRLLAQPRGSEPDRRCATARCSS